MAASDYDDDFIIVLDAPDFERLPEVVASATTATATTIPSPTDATTILSAHGRAGSTNFNNHVTALSGQGEAGMTDSSAGIPSGCHATNPEADALAHGRDMSTTTASTASCVDDAAIAASSGNLSHTTPAVQGNGIATSSPTAASANDDAVSTDAMGVVMARPTVRNGTAFMYLAPEDLPPVPLSALPETMRPVTTLQWQQLSSTTTAPATSVVAAAAAAAHPPRLSMHAGPELDESLPVDENMMSVEHNDQVESPNDGDASPPDALAPFEARTSGLIQPQALAFVPQQPLAMEPPPLANVTTRAMAASESTPRLPIVGPTATAVTATAGTARTTTTAAPKTATIGNVECMIATMAGNSRQADRTVAARDAITNKRAPSDMARDNATLPTNDGRPGEARAMPPKKKQKTLEATAGTDTDTATTAPSADSGTDGGGGKSSTAAAKGKVLDLYGRRFILCPIEGLLCALCGIRITVSLVRKTFREAIFQHVNSACHKEKRQHEGNCEQEKTDEIIHVLEGFNNELEEWAFDFARLDHEKDIRGKIEKSLRLAEKCERCLNPKCPKKLIHPDDKKNHLATKQCKGFKTEPAWGRRSKHSELVPSVSWPKYVPVAMDANNHEVPFNVSDSNLEAILDEVVFKSVRTERANQFEANHGKVKTKLGKAAEKVVFQLSNPREVLAVIDTKKYGKNHMEIAIYEMLNQFNCPHIIRMLGYASSRTLPNESGILVETETESPDAEQDPERYRCITLEYANVGDLQTYMYKEYEKWKSKDDGKSKEAILSPDVIRSIFFQVLVALHVAAKSFKIKHNDIQPNNILIHREEPQESSQQLYRIDNINFLFTLQDGVVAKINDFGQADFWIEDDTPITVERFGTLESCPIDVFLHGNRAVHGHHRDMFCLGLILFNLAAGNTHYDLQADAPCPLNLRKALETIVTGATGSGVDAPYAILPRALGANVANSFDTLYIYLVLFGLDQLEGQSIAESPLCNAIITNLNGPDKVAFEKDRARFDLKTGRDPRIALARQGLSHAGVHLVCQLCAFDPRKRPKTEDILKNAEYLNTFRNCSNVPDRYDFVFPKPK